MSLNRSTIVLLALSSMMLASFSFYKLWKKMKQSKNQTKTTQQPYARQLYINQVSDPVQFRIKKYQEITYQFIQNLVYSIIINLNKGNTYEGVILISFELKPIPKKFHIDFNGANISFLSINNKKIQQDMVKYIKHQIQIPINMLKKGLNKIQIIFDNKYSFLDDGLTSYFKLDNNNKYSLKEQVVYAKNGYSQINKIIPCLNCMNPCEVKLDILHPQNFQSYSNAPKASIELCSVDDYPNYSLFFTSPRLNRSFTASMFTNSQQGPDTILKTSTKFYPINLYSIHQLFIYSSMITQFLPADSKNKLLIRYFGKEYLLFQARQFISLLHKAMQKLQTRIQASDYTYCQSKIDIFFVNDKQVDGYFRPGGILISQEWLKSKQVSHKLLFIIARAIISMGMNQGTPQKVNKILQLNQIALNIVQQSSSLLQLKQIQYHSLKKLINNQFFMSKSQIYVFQYFQYELKYIINNDKKIDSNLKTLVKQLTDPQVYLQVFWKHLIQIYPQLDKQTADLIIRLACQWKQSPTCLNNELKKQARQILSQSRWILQFYTDQQIQNNLDYFLENKHFGLQMRLPKLKIKQKYRDAIIEHQMYQSYIPIKANKQQVKNIYQQFKRFNQQKNFHHYCVLNRQSMRIVSFMGDTLGPQTRDLQCGLNAWKVLGKMQIIPQDHINRELLSVLKEGEEAQLF